jgi:hypothetical protein
MRARRFDGGETFERVVLSRWYPCCCGENEERTCICLLQRHVFGLKKGKAMDASAVTEQPP